MGSEGSLRCADNLFQGGIFSSHPPHDVAFLRSATHHSSAGPVAGITHLLGLREHSSELLVVRGAVMMAEIFFFKGYKSFWKQEALMKR